MRWYDRSVVEITYDILYVIHLQQWKLYGTSTVGHSKLGDDRRSLNSRSSVHEAHSFQELCVLIIVRTYVAVSRLISSYNRRGASVSRISARLAGSIGFL